MNEEEEEEEVVLISSQRYLDEDIVAEKSEAGDYTVTLSPVFEVDGVTYQVVLDGHHSYAAAVADGEEVDYEEATEQDHDAINLIDEPERMLEVLYHDDEWYDIETGKTVW